MADGNDTVTEPDYMIEGSIDLPENVGQAKNKTGHVTESTTQLPENVGKVKDKAIFPIEKEYDNADEITVTTNTTDIFAGDFFVADEYKSK